MIVLLSYSTSWSKSKDAHISFTGGLQQIQANDDSVKIAYDDLRKANAKLVELKYQKEINSKLNAVIANDSVIINNYKVIVDSKAKQIKKYKRERNVLAIGGASAVILLILSLFK